MQRRLLAFSISAVFATACGGDDMPEDAAPIVVDDEVTTAEDTAVVIDVLANDFDPDGEALRLLRVTAIGHAAMVDEGRVRVVPSENFSGNIELTYVATDGDHNISGQISVTVTPVNDAPSATGSLVRTGRNTGVAVRLAGTDIENDALTFAVESGPANGTLTGTAPELTYTPAMNFTGTDAITFVARDGNASSAPSMITLDVIAGAAPVAHGQIVVTLEDTAKAVTLVATDADGDPLGYAITVPPQHGTLTGTMPALTYTPESNYTGADTFRFTATDGLLTSPPGVVSITVTGDNDTPVAENQIVTLSEDAPRGIVLHGSDPEGSPLAYAIVTQPAHGTLTGTGFMRTYTPAANFHGVDTFTFTVSDGFATSAPATVTLGIDSIPDVPVATPQTVAATEDVPLAIALAGTDGDGDELGFTIVTGPAHGTLSGNPTAMTYTPAANYNGSDAFTFTVHDVDHTSQPVTVAITIAPVDDVPVITGAAMTGPEGEFILIPVPVTDVDGEVLTYAVATSAPHGNLYIAGPGPERFYREWGNYHGPDSFALTASDGHATSAPATFTVTVTPTPDAPVAREDIAIATPGQDLRLDVMANDLEFDDEPTTIDSVTAPTHGTVEIDGDEVVYRPQPGILTPDSFTYTISDPGGLTATATVTIGIGGFPSGLPTRMVGRVVHVGSPSLQVLQHDVSADGRYTAVLASIGHTLGDTNSLNDVYVWDRMAIRWERVSVAADGGLANGASERPSISDDGRYVAFASAASNLVAGDTNGSVDVFVRDRVTGTTVRASVGPGGVQVSGTSREPDISADGSVVAFQSTSFQLIPSDANGASDIFVRDLVAGTTTRVSIRTGGGEADFGAFEAALSGDGRVVAFTSAASNLVAGDANNTGDVFVHDRTSGITERVSVSSTGGEGNNLSQGPAISFDGRFVGFRTSATNLIPGSSSGGTLVRDRHAITTTVAASHTVAITISGDGRYVAGHMSNGSSFVRDRFAGVTHLYTGSTGNDAFFPVISGNGRYVLFLSNNELVPNTDPNGTNAWLFTNPL